MTRIAHQQQPDRTTALLFFIIFCGLGLFPYAQARPGLDSYEDPVLPDSSQGFSLYGYQTGLRTYPRSSAQGLPRRLLTVHNENNIQMVETNDGGVGYADYYWSRQVRDPFSGEKIATVQYPRGSNVRYQINAPLLVGAIVDGDTLVTTGMSEIFPDDGALGQFHYRSIDVGNTKFDTAANSQFDIICEYLDTHRVFASADLRPHIPLGLHIKQKAMVWTGENIDDFVLFDLEFQNISTKYLQQMYVGFLAHGGVNYHGEFDYTLIRADDVVGFIPTYPAPEGCQFVDTLNIAYSMDADGDPAGASWAHYSPRAAVGIRIIDVPSKQWRVNFNWSNELGFRGPRFSPRRQATLGHPFRSNLPHLMLPIKDVDMYYYLANPEIDYDQLYTGQSHVSEGWLPPPPRTTDHTVRARPYYLISAGPFELRPGEVQHVAMAVVGGMNVHVNPWDFSQKFNTFNPDPYYRTLDFSNLAANARWAGWIYDNPGVDTDGDGYAGEFRVCNGDTNWYKGDGVPDLRADGPPQSPLVRLIPSEGRITIRWNGFYSETKKDIFTNQRDFEGYRVYMGLDDRESSLTLVSSYDRENYDRFRWVVFPDSTMGWVNEGFPFTADSLRKMFNDRNFRPLRYTPAHPQQIGDTLYYYKAHGFNASSLCCKPDIHKAYPNAQDPGDDPSQWTDADITTEHGTPLPKYYEYEYVLESLLPSIPYWFAVTAYDFGFAGGNIPSKESNPLNNQIMELAQTPSDTVEKYDLDAYVYPNPWRWDGNYTQRGYENRDGTEIPDRSHRINFSNLPKVCKISIYSLDGDLIRELDHNYADGGPASMHDSWDMITRNAQLVVSGIYYYVIESRDRTQMGKFVILR